MQKYQVSFNVRLAVTFEVEKEPVEGSLACEDHVVYEDGED